MRRILKKLAIPALALTALLAFVSPQPASARVHFGVYLGGPYAYPYPYSYYNPYVYPYSYGYPYPYGGFYWAPGFHGHIEHHSFHGHAEHRR